MKIGDKVWVVSEYKVLERTVKGMEICDKQELVTFEYDENNFLPNEMLKEHTYSSKTEAVKGLIGYIYSKIRRAERDIAYLKEKLNEIKEGE
jgi:hypothetical protein